jgi:hypothetical protein
VGSDQPKQGGAAPQNRVAAHTNADRGNLGTFMPPRLPLDPKGYYARLGVEPHARRDAIVAAFRRKARTLHPDVAGTGDNDAFVALKQAYDVLAHAERRAAYDRPASEKHAKAAEETDAWEIGAMPFPDVPTPPTRHPRWRDLPVAVWAGLAIVLIVGVIEIGVHLWTASSPPPRETIPATGREVRSAAPGEAATSAYGPAPVRLAGTPNFYILPASTPTMLWREDSDRRVLVPWGVLPPFSAVQGIRLFRSNGMVEVRVTDTANGLIEAGRLSPGDTAAAARAWCTYNSGPMPQNGEVLARNAHGRARLTIDNHSGQPAVVKLRSPDGGLVAAVFLGPEGRTTLDDLPETEVRADFATGEAWSRACRGFTAGMRAQRVARPIGPGTDSDLAIPPDPASSAVDLSDQAFEQE